MIDTSILITLAFFWLFIGLAYFHGYLLHQNASSTFQATMRVPRLLGILFGGRQNEGQLSVAGLLNQVVWTSTGIAWTLLSLRLVTHETALKYIGVVCAIGLIIFFVYDRRS